MWLGLCNLLTKKCGSFIKMCPYKQKLQAERTKNKNCILAR
jgi:hypothetical protein